MSKFEEVFDLIHSLQASEKRDLKLKVYDKAKPTRLQSLYKEIDNLASRDENLLIKKLQKRSLLPKNLAKAYFDLYYEILNKLRQLGKDVDGETLLHHLIEQARFLRKKGLYAQSSAILEKAKKNARSLENHAQLIPILRLQKTLLKEGQNKDYESKLLDLIREQTEACRILEIESQIEALSDKLFTLLRRDTHTSSPQVQQEALTLRNDPVLSPENVSLTFRTQRLFYHIQAVFAQIQGNYPEAQNAYGEMLTLIASPRARLLVDSQTRRKAIANYLNFCHNLGDYAPFQDYLPRILQIPANNEDEKGENFQLWLQLSQIHLSNTDRLEEARQLFEDQAPLLKQYRAKINKARELTLYHNQTVILWALGKYEEALALVTETIRHRKYPVREDLQSFARLMELFLIFDQKGVVTEKEQRRVKRSLERSQRMGEFEKTILRFFYQIREQNDRNTLLPHLQHLKQSLGDLSHGSQRKNEVLYWVQSKIQGITFRQAMKAEQMQV